MNNSRLNIKNIGPIKNIDIALNRVNVIIGPQSSGKSTISKILCHCQWVEKQLFIDYDKMEKYYSDGDVFYSELSEYHRLEGYFMSSSRFSYKGEFVHIQYNHKEKKVVFTRRIKSNYKYLKIGYIPSERNIVSAVPNLKKYNETNDVIMYFMYDWFSARSKYKARGISRILNNAIDYKFIDEKDFIEDGKREILLSNASSGLQSIMPLYIVVNYLLENLYNEKQLKSYKLQVETEEMLQRLNKVKIEINAIQLNKYNNLETRNNDLSKLLSELQKFNIDIKMSKITDVNIASIIEKINSKLGEVESRFLYKYSQLCIEEPEQNLFPDTQRRLVYQLMKDVFDQLQKHSVVITTHSPYILFALNNCMMGGLVGANIPMERYKDFESHGSWIDPKMVSIWQIENGELVSLQDDDGILEDNYLNQASNNNSNEYLKLLNYYDEE